jgi:basic membrane protein A and related proteins
VKRALWIALALVALAILLNFVPARKTSAAPPRKGPRIGLVFDVGGRGDKSFNDAAYAGLLRAEQELDVRTSFLEPTGSEDREAALRLFAAQGYDLVIAVGFIFASDVDAVARAYPRVSFACVDCGPGPKGFPPNVAGLVFKEEEGSFLVGVAAGMLTKTKHVGFVGGMKMPLIEKFEDGYARGVKKVCPACVVHSGYAGASPDAFKDPAKGKALAISQIAAGADVLYHASGATGHGVFEAAKDARVLAIGVDSDQHDEMPGTVVTSMIKRVDVAVLETIRAVVEKRFTGGLRVFGLPDRGVDWVKDGPHAAGIPPAVRAEVERWREELASGRARLE